DDVTAWCILAALIAFVKAGTFMNGFYTLAFAMLYISLMFRLIRPLLQKLSERYSTRETLGKPVVAVFFLVLILSAYAAEVIGMHALFGAFPVGAIVPDAAHFRRLFLGKVEAVALVLL